MTGLQKLFDHTFLRRRRQPCAKVFFYNEGTLADTVIRHQPAVNYAKDDLQIQLPFVSGKMIEVPFSIDIRPTCHNKILRITNKARPGCKFKYKHIFKQK